MTSRKDILQNLASLRKKKAFHNVIDVLIERPYYTFDMSDKNPDFEKTEMFATVGWFESYVEETMKKQHVPFGVGKFAEDRKIYRSLPLFGGRSVHLGVDLWAPAGSSVYAPWNGIIHSFNDNHHKGDYGPTIILEHPDLHVFTLYGHLSRESLEGKEKGQIVKKGQQIASFGVSAVNGGWPPHLHFQVMTTMLDKEGDFPGVCVPEEKEHWVNEIMVDPEYFLGLHDE